MLARLIRSPWIIVLTALPSTMAWSQMEGEAAVYSSPPAMIKMYPGDSRVLTAPSGHRQLYISRRGIIDVTQTGPQTWHVMALKKGIVTLQFDSFEAESTNPPRKFHIEVGSAVKRDQALAVKKGGDVSQTFDLPLQLQAWLVMDEQAETSHHGVHFTLKKLLENAPLLTKEQFSEQLARNQTNILAAPFLQLAAGEEAAISSGGEFRSSESSERGTLPLWKEYGTIFLFRAIPISNDQVKLFYEVELKDLSGSSNQQILTGGRYRGTLTFPLGVTHLLGSMDVISDRRSIDLSYYLVHLPILGPLLKGLNRQSRSSKLYLFVHLSGINTQN